MATADDRPSWSDTLSGELPESVGAEILNLSAELDRLDQLLARYERESDRPPEDPGPDGRESPPPVH